MTTEVKSLDKRSGITYIYQSTSYWDKVKKAPRCKRVLIAKLDPVTGERVPTDGRGKRRRQKEQSSTIAKPGPVPSIRTERLFYGAAYLLDQIGDKLGIQENPIAGILPHTGRYQRRLSLRTIRKNSSTSLWQKHPFPTEQ